MNSRETNSANWEQPIWDELEKFGAVKFRNLKDGEPYVLIGKRGLAPGEAFEKMADPNDIIPTKEQLFILPTNFDILASSGTLFSNTIGPAKTWKYFYRNLNKSDNNQDKVSFAFQA